MKRLVLIWALCLCGLISSGQTIISEDFQSGALPAGWTRSQSSPSFGWEFGDSSDQSGFWKIPDHSLFSVSNDDEHDNATHTLNLADQDYLISPSMDFSTFSMVFMEVDVFYTRLYGSRAYIKVRVATGPWTTVLEVAPESTWQDGLTLNLSPWAGVSDVQIGFHHDDQGSWGSGFAIDNFTVLGSIVKSYDARVDTAKFTTEYPSFPVFGAEAMGFNVRLKSESTDTVSGIRVNFSLEDVGDGVVYTSLDSFAPMGPWNAERKSVSGTYTPIDTGSYAGGFNVEITELDGDPTNDSTFFTFQVTDTILARDDGIIRAGMQFGPGATIGPGTENIRCGQMFRLPQNAFLSSATILVDDQGMTLSGVRDGDEFAAYVHPMSGGLINESITLGVSDTVSTHAGDVVVVLPFPLKVWIPAGTEFAIVIRNLSPSWRNLIIPVGKYTSGGSFIFSSFLGGWANNDVFAVPPAYFIRANVYERVIDTILSPGGSHVICEGDSIAIAAMPGAAAYQWYEGGIAIPGATTGIFQATSAGTYQAVISAGPLVDTSVSVVVATQPSYHFPDTVEICRGDSAFIFGEWKKYAGLFYDSLSTIEGCDSIYSSLLIVHNITYDTLPKYLCDGDSVFVGGAWRSSSGLYTDVLISSKGCDSIVSLDVTVDSILLVEDSINIFPGDSIFLGGAWQDTAGVYVDTFEAIAGCDSIVTTTLTVIPPVSIPNIAEGPEIQLYPNPTSGGLFIRSEASGKFRISLFDSRGGLVLRENIVTEPGQPVLIPEIERFPSGIYSMVIESQNNRMTKRLVIQ